MAFHRLGLGGVLTFEERQAVQAIGRTDQAFTRLTGRLSMVGTSAQAMATKATMAFQKMSVAAQRLRTGLTGVGTGLRNFAIAALPASLALRKGVKTAADFQHQMQGVKAILKGIAFEDMENLRKKAKHMGVVSVFSARQSGQAMEFLARAGFSANEIMGAIDQTIYAAAAEEMNLADASRLVANNVRAFGLAAGDAGRIADVLALSSARTNTTMLELGEGLKYAAPFARMLGVDVEHTSAALGLLADSGLQGSIGGTALKNALIKLAAPAGKGREALEKLGLTVADAHGNFVGLESILRQLQRGMNDLGGNVSRAAAAADLFGLRGIAVTNLLSRLDKAAEGGALTFAELTKQLKEARGAAKEMAETRLDSLRGQLVLLKSSVEAAFIELFEPATKLMQDSVTEFIGGQDSGLNGVLFTVQKIKEVGWDAWMSEVRAMEAAGGQLTTVQQIAMGFHDAMVAIGNAWSSFRDSVVAIGQKIRDTIGGEGVRHLTSFLIKLVSIIGVLGPLLLILGLLKMAIGGIGMMILGLGKTILAVFSPWGLVIAAIVAAVVLLKDQLMGIASVLWEKLKPIAETVGKILKNVFLIVGGIIKVVGKILGWLFGVSSDGTKAMADEWTVVGQIFGVVGFVLKGISFVVDAIREGLEAVVDVILWIPRKLGLVEEKVEATTRKVTDMARRAGEEIGGPMMGQAIASRVEEHVNNIDLSGLSAKLKETTGDAFAEGLKRGAKTANLTGMYSAVESLTKKGIIDGTEAGLAKAAAFYQQTPREYLARQGIMEPTPERLLKAKHFLARGLRETREEAAQLQLKKQADIEASRRARMERLARMSPRERERYLLRESRAEAAREKEVNVNIKNTTCIDGRAVSTTMAKHQTQIQERLGAKAKHWQTKIQREFGAAPGTVNLAVGS